MTKINITFFAGNVVSNVFYFTILSKKKKFPNNNREKYLIIFGGMTIFEGTGSRTTKMSINFSTGNGVPIPNTF